MRPRGGARRGEAGRGRGRGGEGVGEHFCAELRFHKIHLPTLASHTRHPHTACHTERAASRKKEGSPSKKQQNVARCVRHARAPRRARTDSVVSTTRAGGGGTARQGPHIDGRRRLPPSPQPAGRPPYPPRLHASPSPPSPPFSPCTRRRLLTVSSTRARPPSACRRRPCYGARPAARTGAALS